MINVNGFKRNAKNIVKKYSDAQIKVREATSNDPWGPSSTLMAEIADLTYNLVAFSEIMQMLWKRLNDHGKNWRHVYKALVVLEYLIKTGTDKEVAQQCMENIFAIQTLKDFQHMEDNKDYGKNIREKSKKLVDLLKDSDKLKIERARAIKAKSRLAESLSSVGKSSLNSGSASGSGASASGTGNGNGNGSLAGLGIGTGIGGLGIGAGSGTVTGSGSGDTPIDAATAFDEENQLKLALALSKEEAEQQEKTEKNDELRLKLALYVSKQAANDSLLDDSTSSLPSTSQQTKQTTSGIGTSSKSSNIDDLLGLTISPPEPQNDPWSSDPWSSDPWR